MQKFRVWYIPQIPWKPFQVTADTFEEWKKLLETIINFSIFEFKERVKPDYSDASWMEYFYTDEDNIFDYVDEDVEIEEIDWVKWIWQEWYDEDWNDIDELLIINP